MTPSKSYLLERRARREPLKLEIRWSRYWNRWFISKPGQRISSLYVSDFYKYKKTAQEAAEKRIQSKGGGELIIFDEAGRRSWRSIRVKRRETSAN